MVNAAQTKPLLLALGLFVALGLIGALPNAVDAVSLANQGTEWDVRTVLSVSRPMIVLGLALAATSLGSLEFVLSTRVPIPWRWPLALTLYFSVIVAVEAIWHLSRLPVNLVDVLILLGWSFAAPRLWSKYWPSLKFGVCVSAVFLLILNLVTAHYPRPFVFDETWRFGFPMAYAGVGGYPFFDAGALVLNITSAICVSLGVGLLGRNASVQQCSSDIKP